MRPTLTQVHLVGGIGIRRITLCMSELSVGLNEVTHLGY